MPNPSEVRLATLDGAGNVQQLPTLDQIPAATSPCSWGSELLTFGAGDSVTVFTPDPGAQLVAMKRGTAASPDETYGPLLHSSRTISVPESAFTGDGAHGLAAISGVTKVKATSEGQGIGLFGGAVTEGTHAGAHSLADGVGVYGIGVSTSTATRTGMGLFASGRREGENGVATGAQIVADNESGVAGIYNKSGASNVKALYLGALGTANAAEALGIGSLGQKFLVAIGIKEGSTVEAGYRDDSSALRSILVKGTHEKGAIVIAPGSGILTLGVEEPSSGSHLLELFNNATADPIAKIGSGATGASTSLEWHNAAAQMKIFMSGGNNAFLTGTINGDSGINFTPEKTFHIGRITHRGMLRVSEGGIGIGELEANSFGGGKGVVFIANATTGPTENPVGGGILFVSAGALKYRGSSGTVTEIAKA